MRLTHLFIFDIIIKYKGVEYMEKVRKYDYKDIESIKKLIEKNGCTFTYQRNEILKEFVENNDKHLNAKEIYDKLKYKKIGVSTIYRTLKLFTDLNILKEIKINDINYYELKIFIREPIHMHFQCKNCRVIEDIFDEKILLRYLEIKKILEKKYRYKIKDVDIIFYGLCNNCIEKFRKR